MTLQLRTRSLNRAGFTITELLIVVGIIVLLASIGVVVGKRAIGTADKTRLRAQIQTIEKALEAYKTDFGSFPLTDGFTTNNVNEEINRDGLRGARTLCKALVAPTPGLNRLNSSKSPSYENQDGKTGPGFRIVGRSGVPRYKGGPIEEDELLGKEYGPYLSGNAIKWSKTTATGTLDPGSDYDDTTVLLDANDNVILYYPALNTQPNLTRDDAYIGVGPTNTQPGELMPMYRWTDNSAYVTESGPTTRITEQLFKTLLGDKDGDGAINKPPVTNESAVVKNQPLLISAGRDGLFGPNPNDKNKENDDVTNFAE